MRLYDKALVAKIHENQFTKEVDGIPVLFKPVPDAEPAHLDPRLREIIIKKRTMFANRAKAGWTLSSERYRPDKVTYDLIETPVDCTEQLIPIGGHKMISTSTVLPTSSPTHRCWCTCTAVDSRPVTFTCSASRMQYIAEQSGARGGVPGVPSGPREPLPRSGGRMHGAPYSGCTHTPLNWVPTCQADGRR